MSAANVAGYPIGESCFKYGQTSVMQAYANQHLYTHEGVSTAIYRVTWYACLTQAATNSSWIGGVNGFQIVYNPSEAGPSVTSPAQPLTTGQYNTVGTTIGSNIAMCAVVPGGNIGFSFGYSSVGTVPAQYAIHIRIEYMGDITQFNS